jgi:cellulose synthase/poly-beta-1,6-N-acetylglucosamine synthase-like glycosyltransferase
MVALYWTLLGLVGWTYVGYPLLLGVLGRLSRRTLEREPIEPSVTLIIAAFNEEKDIAKKLDDSLAIDYPKEKLQIVVASDCSSDRTHEIVESYADRGVQLVALPQRAGKTAGQNAAAKVARGEVMVFTDATTELASTVIRGLVEGFADDRVGCVGAELEYVSEGGTAVGKGGGAYWRYEKKVKELEARVNSLIGVSGCLYAVRTSAYRPIPPDLISDFVIAGDVFSRGYITVYGRGAVSSEKTHEESGKEFDMRVRVAIRTINALVRRAGMLNPFRHGFFAFQLFSHKVLRYLVPELLLAVLAITVWLVLGHVAPVLLYQVMLAGQVAVYVGAVVGWLCLRWKIKIPLVHIPFYFVHANMAALVAFFKYLRGERKVTWATVRQ